MDLKALKATAEAVVRGERSPDDLYEDANPQTILDLIGRVEELERNLAAVMATKHAPVGLASFKYFDCLCVVHEDARKLISQKG